MFDPGNGLLRSPFQAHSLHSLKLFWVLFEFDGNEPAYRRQGVFGNTPCVLTRARRALWRPFGVRAILLGRRLSRCVEV
jgi:hypothetical protein